jgi:hypothetical protein
MVAMPYVIRLSHRGSGDGFNWVGAVATTPGQRLQQGKLRRFLQLGRGGGGKVGLVGGED